jgi:hypothetical protein
MRSVFQRFCAVLAPVMLAAAPLFAEGEKPLYRPYRLVPDDKA